MRNFFNTLARDPFSLIGATIVTASVVLIAILFLLELIGSEGNPYTGVLAYLILPGFLVLGLLLIPVGVLRHRRRVRRARALGVELTPLPVIDLNRQATRKIALTFLLLTMANVVILAVASYKGVEVMDSTEFCGTACHSVMHPEYTAYTRSPHARVKCVECHIGPGADWFVKSKLSGAWQFVAVAFDLYPRPIPTPIENLRPARETCEQCHWPEKFVGDRLKVLTHYEEDEANTELKTVLLLKIGGIQGRVSQGIHWHVDPAVRIRYQADPRRRTIYDVELTEADGTVKLFKGPEQPPTETDEAADAGAEGPVWRTMDCVDCHNRPTHIYRMPEQEIDDALRLGRISRDLPFIRREGLAALRVEYASHAEARKGIAAALQDYYRREHAELSATQVPLIDSAAEVLGELYALNVFPEMNVQWGTYPDFIGHQYFDGCFRCHNDEHATADGETISQDCFNCHSLLAMDEENPQILAELQP